MRTADFRFDLPPELIAQTPAPTRDGSRLMVLDRSARSIDHCRFIDFPDYPRPGDLLVLNDSRVIPARLRGTKVPTGSAVEVLLVEECSVNDWWVMLRPGKRVRAGTVLSFSESVTATVTEKSAEGQYRLKFSGTNNIADAADALGEIPLPPYIVRQEAPGEMDRERYQTVFAENKGSVAAPTAGLHFTQELLDRLAANGVETAKVTLHVGLGTFAPIKTDLLADHRMHYERFQVSEITASKVNATRARGGRVIAVGTTSLRVLESVAAAVAASRGNAEVVTAMSGRTNLFVRPPYEFRVVDTLLTNFHLPESTLMMLVSAFASPGQEDGREWILQAYAEAVRERYRFFSYGDAMLIHS